MQQAAHQAIPANVLAVLNRAADSAAKALRGAGIPANRRALHATGAGILVEQVELSGGQHPETAHALGFLHDVLVDMMVAERTD